MSEPYPLPAGWCWSPLADLLTGIETGKSFKCDERPPTNDEVGVIKVSAVTWGEYQEQESKTCTDPERVNPALFVQRGDFLFSRANTIELVGACVIAQQVTLRTMLSDKILRFRFRTEAMKAWALYLLRSKQGRQQIEALSSGNQDSMRNIGQERIGQIQVPVPPAAEQTRIVQKLEELLSDLAAGVAELKAARKKLQQYRQSLLKAAVEGSLTAAWREAHPAPEESGTDLLARILRERRARWEAQQLAKFEAQGKAPPKGWQGKYSEPVEIDPSSRPALPPGWAWASVDQLAHVGTGVTPLRSKSAYFEDGDIPWVTSGALNAEHVSKASENVTRLALQECRLEVFPPGSLLVAMYGEGKTRGKCAELAIPATINQAVAAVVLAPSAQPCKAYVKAYLLKSYEAMRQQASGGVQPNLNLQIVKALAVPLPPLSEQAEIVSLLAAQTDSLAALTEGVHTLQLQSTAQRQNLLRAAFAGQLVPQDPADEPAAELLGRIRAERAAQGSARRPRANPAHVANSLNSVETIPVGAVE